MGTVRRARRGDWLAWDRRRARRVRRVARGGPNDANQCKRLRASHARCRPHSSRVAAMVVRRARRPCSAYTWEVCNRQGYCPCCGADAAARQQQCDEQCSNHYCCTAGAWWRELEADRPQSAPARARHHLFSHSPKRSLASRKHRVHANNSNTRTFVNTWTRVLADSEIAVFLPTATIFSRFSS